MHDWEAVSNVFHCKMLEQPGLSSYKSKNPRARELLLWAVLPRIVFWVPVPAAANTPAPLFWLKVLPSTMFPVASNRRKPSPGGINPLPLDSFPRNVFWSAPFRVNGHSVCYFHKFLRIPLINQKPLHSPPFAMAVLFGLQAVKRHARSQD